MAVVELCGVAGIIIGVILLPPDESFLYDSIYKDYTCGVSTDLVSSLLTIEPP